MSSYILCKVWGFFKEYFFESIRYIGLKFSEITEIVKPFQYSEILFLFASSDNNKHMLMSKKCKKVFAYSFINLSPFCVSYVFAVFFIILFWSFFSLFLSSGSVIAGFDIEYNVKNFSLIEDLNDTVSRTGYLYNMPLQLIELAAQFGNELRYELKPLSDRPDTNNPGAGDFSRLV